MADAKEEIEAAAAAAQRPIEIDQVIVTCKGCRKVRTFYPDAPLVGAQAFITWMHGIAPCGRCRSRTCDVKARLKGEKVAT